MPSRTTSRRLLATLSAAPATTSTAAPAALLPPYTHALPDTAVQPGHAPSSAMRPPYTFVLQPSTITGPSATLKSKVSFKLLEPCERAAQQAVRWRAWAEGLVSTDAGRAHVQKAWTASIIALERAKSSGNRTPEVAFQALGDHLRADTALEAIRQTGSLVVRDVVPDGQAMAWAREILELLEAREGHPVYWSDAQLAARSNPSVLSANKQVSAALLGEQGEPYIDASAVRVGVAEVSPPPRILDLSTGASSSWSTSPTLAHLALTATRATLPATDHAATYALLRPLFRPLRSRLSFYHPSGYLDPANWAMLAAAELAVPAPVSPIAVPAAGSASLESRGGAKWLPHLEGTWTSTDLAPGDMLYRQAAIPAQNPLLSGEEGLTLPVSPLPSASSEDLVHAQRAAFEAGLPPPQAQREGSVAIEDGRSAHDIATGGGRRAMGF